MKKISPFVVLIFISGVLLGQQTTTEDSLQKGFKAFMKGTTIGGYGDLFYQRNFDQKTSLGDLERFVLFVGHKFNKNISLFSELEVEDAKVVGGQVGGEVSLEQAYIKFDINPQHYIVAGLFLPRIGILNENHLPTSFNGNERTQVETNIIPTTWREIGVGYYGSLKNIPLNFTLAVMNGLNASGFVHGDGIREGVFEGRNATFNNLAVTASVQYTVQNLRLQVSGYCGGSVGIGPRQADSLELESGIFGSPVILGEADAMYSIKGFGARVLGTVISIPDAAAINRAYANNTPQTEYGAYIEVSYNIFEEIKKVKAHQLIVFVRYEKLDMNAAIPSNGIIDGTVNQQHIIAGFGYLPIKNIVIKADVRLMHTGPQNPDLVINPSPVALPYRTNNQFLTIGIGWSF
jgi:hypothetical protein